MSWATNLVGSGAGIIAIAVGFLLLQHMSHAPQFTHPWLRRGVIILMYAGGASLAVTYIGQETLRLIELVAGWFGGLDYGLIRTVLVIALLFLLVGTVVGLIWSPDPGTAMVAIILPVLLALPLGGFLHEVYVAFDGPALALAAGLNHILAG